MIRTIINEEDAKYIVDAHWRTYTEEYQYDRSFIEFFTNPILPYYKNLDLGKENMWILEIDGKPKGTISIMKIDENTAQLRWFLIEPEARNSGYGKKLIQQAIQFCKDNDYKTIFLWTNSILTTARKIYERNGFKLTKSRDRILSNREMKEEKFVLILDQKDTQY